MDWMDVIRMVLQVVWALMMVWIMVCNVRDELVQRKIDRLMKKMEEMTADEEDGGNDG